MIRSIKTIGVIGAGQMGSGIAFTLACSGYKVIVQDISENQLSKAQHYITATLKKYIERGKINENFPTHFKRFHFTLLLEDLKKCDLVIEAATENEQTKAAIFKALIPHLREKTIIATNTSSLSITRLASYTDRLDRFIGMHFMNPVPIMKLVEVIRGLHTCPKTYNLVLQLIERMKKEFAVSNDNPGFIINRILMPMINESIFTLYEGVASVEDIDKGMRLGAHQPMGPLELADFIGLDTCLSIMKVLHEEIGDSKYRPCPLLVRYVDAGWIGRKSGCGFYDYSHSTPQPTTTHKLLRWN